MNKIKKRKSVIILIVVLVCLVVLANIIVKKYINEKDKLEGSYRFAHQYIQMLYGYVQTIDLAEKSNISIEQPVANEIKKFTYDLYELIDESGYPGASLTELSKLGYIYSFYDLNCDNIKKRLEKYYIEDEKLFNLYLYSGENSKVSSYVGDTVESDRILNNARSNLFEGYNVKQGLENWFNENIEQSIQNNESLTVYYDILYDFYIHSYSLENLKYQYLENNMMAYLDEISKITYTEGTSIDDVALLDDAIYITKIYPYNKDFFEISEEQYNRLVSEEGYYYDVNDEISIFLLSCYLNIHYVEAKSIYNDFLANNLSDMIIRHFEKHCKGKLENIYEHLEN